MDYKKVLGDALASKKPGGWLGQLTVKQVKELQLLHTAYNRLDVGQRPAVETLRRLLCEELKLKIGKDSFREWLKSPNSSSVQSSRNSKSSKSVRTSAKNGGKG